MKAAACSVAVIGAGNMGGAMVERLCAMGWPLVVCDIDPLRQQQALNAGAALADTPALAASALTPDGVLIVCVVDAAQSHQVLFGECGAASVMRPGQAVMLCPTIAPEHRGPGHHPDRAGHWLHRRAHVGWSGPGA